MVRDGFDLFWAAVCAVLNNWRVALKIAVVPVSIAASVYAVDQYFWILALESGQDYQGLQYLSFALDVWMVGFVAGAWHRFVLLGETPNPTWPKISFDLATRYAIYWFIIGIVLVVVLVALPVTIYAVLDHYVGVDDLMFEYGYMDVMTVDGLFSPVVIAVFGAIFVYGLFRCALGLPDMAVGVGRLSMLGSLRRTRPLRGPIFVVALLAGAAQAPLLEYPRIVQARLDVGTAIEVAAHGFIGGILWGIVALFGASILTELYRATAGGPVHPD